MLVLASFKDLLSGMFMGPPVITYNKHTETREEVSYTLLGNVQFNVKTDCSKLCFPWFSSASPYSRRKNISI